MSKITLPDGTDRVTLHTDLPSTFPDDIRAGNLELDFEVQKGKGIQYVKTHFGYPHMHIESIDVKTGEHKVIGWQS